MNRTEHWTTPDLCDAHAEYVRVVTGIDWRSFGGRAKFHGPIRTARCFEDNSRVKERLAEPGNGAVLVVDGGGSLRHALIGDQIAAAAQANGWAGVVIHGACRDVEVLAGIDLGVLALGAVPIKSVRRGEGQADVPVSFGGVVLRPGEYLYADANGVIVADRVLA
ncbi:MAG: ribonuclease E activity regulator RraA [Wenzhouxiangellaceae bacterium]|nr:ribonuclease E activity regulator RraA [Wenzhouxiangellaceae bacterium]